MNDRTDAGGVGGTEWLLAAIIVFVVCVGFTVIGYSIGPCTLGTLGVAGIVAPVLLGLRWSRERRR